MSGTDLVSIIMPVYNAERTLKESVESVLAQRHQNWELILIDDGSKDGSIEQIEQFAGSDSRIKSLILPKNLGASGARNAGVQIASGRFIAFLDSDDIWLPEKLSKQLAAIDSSTLALCFTDYDWINAEGSPLGITVKAQDRPTWSNLTWGNNIGLSTTLIDRERTGDPMMLPLRLNHDFALWLELLRKGHQAIRVPESLVLYRVHSGSLSQNKFESFALNWKILRRIENLSVPSTLIRLFVWGIRTSVRRIRSRRLKHSS
jgi:teichuronic acid biosynthesis glycosyltransferase TuaG